ncbi:MAG: alpha-L-fucosidase [Prevotellaceae bacterium]|jgi:alpha-L-fucosidase|nr:alpha-L-fucosidase [Prevotellaceae bacterium]
MNKYIFLILTIFYFTMTGYGQTALQILHFSDGDIPLAPKDYRRPSGIDPGDDYDPALFRYPYTLKDMQEKFSDDMMQRAAKEYRRMTDVNSNGTWKPDWLSLMKHQTPEWFSDIKFGMFIDWGLWSVAGYTLLLDPDREVYPDWYEYQMIADNNGPRRYDKHGKIFSLRQYHEKNWGKDFSRGDFIPLFTAENFNADKLTDLAVEAGMKYVIPFCKHFSGWCIWQSSYTHMDVGERLGEDIMQPLVDNCKKKGLKFGFYYGTQEWEYPIITDSAMVIREWFRMRHKNPAAPYTPEVENLIPGKIPVRNFLRDYSIPQAVEFIDKYDPDILWYDGDWDTMAEDLGSYEISAYFYNKAEGRKQVAVNDRYGLKKEDRRTSRARLGDIFTSEHHSIHESKKNGDHAWEENRGISSSFGFNWQDTDENVISSKTFIDMFVDIVAEGGNLLLIVNPDGKGALPDAQVKRLKDIGKWLKVNGEGIYNTRPYTTPKEGFIRYTRSKDGKTVYAICTEFPKDKLTLSSVTLGKTGQITMLGAEDVKLKWTSKTTADQTQLIIKIPKSLYAKRASEYAWVFKITLQ